MTNEGVEITHLEKPKPARGEALLKVKTAGICNTDIEISRGYMGFQGTLGHEFVGSIVGFGPDTESLNFQIGDRVVSDINYACDACAWCHSGRRNHCPNRTVIGIVSHDGGMAEFVRAPVRNLYHVPPEISDDAATFIEPLAAAIHAFEGGVLEKDCRVAVIGDGKLGLLIAKALSLHLDQVSRAVLIGRHPQKMKIVNSLGLETLESKDVAGNEFDVVVEASGQPSGLALGLSLLRPRGRLVLKSTFAVQDTALDLSSVVVNELQVIGSRCGHFPAAIEALAKRKIDPTTLISHRYQLDDAIDAFETAQTKGTLKVLLEMHTKGD